MCCLRVQVPEAPAQQQTFMEDLPEEEQDTSGGCRCCRWLGCSDISERQPCSCFGAEQLGHSSAAAQPCTATCRQCQPGASPLLLLLPPTLQA